MKKMISLCAVLLCMGMASAQTNFYQNSSYISDTGAKPEVKTVLNYDKNLIMGYTITFNYDAKDIETAVTERLEKEGVETRVDMHLRKAKSKGIAIDGQKIKKAADSNPLANIRPKK